MKKTKHTVALALAAMLACQPISAYAAAFADMNQVPWPGAEASINKAASLGLVVGETKNGKTYFRPKDSVSLSESCQLAYKILLQTGKTTADSSITQKWTPVMSAYGIQTWAYPAVAFCLENGILTSPSNLSGFMKNGANLPATREQAATILGRALTTGSPSYASGNSSTSFKDDNQISSEAKPYVAMLHKAGVINGDNTNQFNPKKTLNRTETSVLVTNLYGVLEKAAPAKPAEPTNPVVSTQKGSITTMTNFYVNLKEKPSAYYMFASSGTTVTLNGASSSINDVVKIFKSGATIDATLTLDSNLHITKLEATYKVVEKKKTEGKLTKVKYDKDDNSGSITIDKDSTYKIADGDDVDIRIDKKSCTLKQLYNLFTDSEKDDTVIEVEISLNSKDNVSKITGTTKDRDSSDSLKGKISDMSYDKSDKTGYIKLKGKTTKYKIDDTDDVTVKIDGRSKSYKDLYNLYDDDDETISVTLTLDKKDYVTKITATTSDSDSEDDANGTVTSVTYKSGKGTVTIGSKKYSTDKVNDVKLSITDGTTTIGDWEEFYNANQDKKRMEVSVTVNKGEISKITGKVTEAKGNLKTIGDDYIRIEGIESGKKCTYKFNENDVENINVKIPAFSYIKTLDDLIYEYKKGDLIDSRDELELTLTLDKKGNITKITGEYK
nr:S-layer homology domain-containing protein [uncultured Anaerotignum sp.]